MRKREEIEKDMKLTRSAFGISREELICEVLLDIRELLRKKLEENK